MLGFILGLIFGILIILSIIVYYKKIKKVKKVSEITFIHNSLLCLIVKIVNKITKNSFIAITNIFNKRVHIISFIYYDKINEDEILYKHELCHIYQVKKLGLPLFLIKDIFYTLKYGYAKNPLEIEAYELEKKTISEIKEFYK